MANAAGSRAETEVFAGVALFGKSPEADQRTLEWACKRLRLSAKYKLCIIHVDELNNANPPRQRPDSHYGCHDLEAKFKKKYSDCDFSKLQSAIDQVWRFIRGITYEGEYFEATLQHAVDNLKGLDTLILGWSVADDTKGPPINRLDLREGCSIMLAKVDSCTRSELTLFTPPKPAPATLAAALASTEVSAGGTDAAPSSMASALTNQGSDKQTHSSTSSKEKARCPDSETDDTATVDVAPPAPAAEPSTTGKTKTK